MLWMVKERHRENVYVMKRVYGSVPTGNLIQCQMAKAKAGESEVRRLKTGGVKLAGVAEEVVENYIFCPVLLKKQLSSRFQTVDWALILL